MKKSVIGIIMAVTLVGSSLAFPVQAYAQDNNEDIEENTGEVGTNNGKVNYNYGKVTTNNATVEDNEGTVTTNTHNGTVTYNNNHGTVMHNTGTVTTNNGTVTTNNDTGTVTNNTPNGTVMTNDGTVTTNHGTVTTNYGTVTTNNGMVTNNENGTVETNNGTIEDNDWVVKDNTANGTVTNNNGMVTNNCGTITNNHDNATVKDNYGTVTNNNSGTVMDNFGIVETNNGIVVNNYGGTVTAGNGRILNQWYEYILTGGTYQSGSKSTEAGNRTWIGKAEEDGNNGWYYITVAAADGMIFDRAEFTDGSTATYTQNVDGSFTFGNISSAISIFFKQLINNNNNNTNTGSNSDADTDVVIDSNVDTNSANMIASIEAIIASEEAMPVTSFVSNEAVAKIPEAAKNSGASYNLSVITSSQGFTAAVNKISETVKVQNAVNNAGQRITSTTIYSEKPMLFTADVLNAISASDIDFVFVFMHNGKMYKVTIPRGAMIDFTGHVYEGPLYFGQILGTTEVIG